MQSTTFKKVAAIVITIQCGFLVYVASQSVSKPRVKAIAKSTAKPTAQRVEQWNGPYPCRAYSLDIPTTLPRLGRVSSSESFSGTVTNKSKIFHHGDEAKTFTTKEGLKLVIIGPKVSYYIASANDFQEAKTFIRKAQPLGTTIIREDKEVTVLARMRNTWSMTIRSTKNPNTGTYSLDKDRFIFRYSYEIQLPYWTNYYSATSSDQTKWNKYFCRRLNHERGHLLIELDMLDRNMHRFDDLKGSSHADLTAKTRALRDEILAKKKNRQTQYHILSDYSTKEGWYELPYEELPFPWLEE